MLNRETDDGHGDETGRAAAAFGTERPGGEGGDGARRMFDGQGLFLLVTPGGAKIWKQRIAVNGRRQELGLGPYPVVSLREAREAALANRRMVRAGMNPKVERCRARGIPTFAELARADFEHRKGGWRSAKHAHDWNATLERFVFPRLGRSHGGRHHDR